MSKFTFKKLLLIIALASVSMVSFAQNAEETESENKDFRNYLYVTGDFGATALTGDVTKMMPGLSGHLGLGWQFDKFFGLRGNIGYGTLRGEMKNMFTITNSNYLESDINLTISFIDLVAGYRADRLVTLTPHIGIGCLQYKTKIKIAEDNESITIGYNNHSENNLPGKGLGMRAVAATVPMGLEIGFNINPHWNVYLDCTVKYLDTDRIDLYPGGKHNDWTGYLSVGAKYNIKRSAERLAEIEAKEFCNFWYFTLDGGADLLFGDNKAWNMRDIRGNVNIGAGYAFHNFMTVFGKIGYGRYDGQKEKFFTVESANYISTTLNFGIDLVNAIRYKEDRKFGLMPHVGLGLMQYRCTTNKNGETIRLGYDKGTPNVKGNGLQDRRVIAEIPMGIELTYKMNKNFDIYLDGTLSYCNTDILEGVAAGKHDDWIAKANVGVRYKLNTSCERKARKAAEMERMTPQVIQYMCNCNGQKGDATSTNISYNIFDTIKETDTINMKSHRNYTDIMFPIESSERIDNQLNRNSVERASRDLSEGFTISSILVEGYSSPEGSDELNQRLSNERANIAAEFIKEKLGDKIGNAKVTVIGKGCDWEGLYRAIEGSGIEDKDTIVEQIKGASDKNVKLKELMEKYPEIKNLFPQLRRSGVTISTKKQ